MKQTFYLKMLKINAQLITENIKIGLHSRRKHLSLLRLKFKIRNKKEKITWPNKKSKRNVKFAFVKDFKTRLMKTNVGKH